MVFVLRPFLLHRLCWGLGFALLLFLLPVRPSVAQEQRRTADTTRQAPPTTPQRAPTDRPSQSLSQSPQRSGSSSGNEKAGVQFSAQDSLVIVTRPDAQDEGALYGQAQMSYQKATLKGQVIEIDFKTSTLQASELSSDTAQSRPSFQRGQNQSFTGKTLSFNLRTKRGRVVAARTQKRDGYIQGNTVKVFEDSTLFVQDGSYTTCNCPPGQTPSYSLRSDKMKVKDRWVYTGPIHLFLFNIPTPLWLPFGIVPNVPGRRSGPLPPRYGQDRRKGFFLQDWGWYFALNDYTDLQIRASVWSRGSYELNPIFRYQKRYSYQGDLNVTYQRTRIGENEDPNFVNRHRGQLKWSHSQELSPHASIQGNINLVTSSDFARRNTTNYDDAVSQEISSYLRYRKNWPGGGQNLTVGARQRQQLQSGVVRMTLPSLNFSQRQFKPFETEQAVGEERWFEKITTSYDFSLDNKYSFRPRDPEDLRSRGDSTLADSVEQANIAWYEALVDRQKYQLATGEDEPFDFEATHRIPLRASFRVNRYNLSLSPSIRYRSRWHISTQRLVVDTTRKSPSDTLRTRTVPGFYARREFSTGLTATTELFGLFPLRIGPIQGLRHRITPSLSFQYRPNFNAPFWGRTRTLRYTSGTPARDDGTPIRYDILTGRLNPGNNEQRNMSFSLDNELETKYVSVDSTGETQEEKIKLLDFDLDASYNFAADNFKMSNINFGARTTIRDFRINTQMTFSPYALRPRSSVEETPNGSSASPPQLSNLPQQTASNQPVQYTRVDQYMIAENPLTPVRLTSFRLNVGGSLGDQNQRSASTNRRGQQQNARSSAQAPGSQQSPSASPTQQQGRSSRGNQSKGYLDSSLPWSLNFSFSYSFRKPRKRIQNQSATLNTQFTFNITPLWSLQGRTGYDLVRNELATTRINLQRDLGCWVMSLSWTPFGSYQSYSFNLQVKSGQLSQLLRLQIPNSGQGTRLGGIGQRLQRTAGGLSGGSLGGGR